MRGVTSRNFYGMLNTPKIWVFKNFFYACDISKNNLRMSSISPKFLENKNHFKYKDPNVSVVYLDFI